MMELYNDVSYNDVSSKVASSLLPFITSGRRLSVAEAKSSASDPPFRGVLAHPCNSPVLRNEVEGSHGRGTCLSSNVERS